MIYAPFVHTTLPGIKKLSHMNHNVNVLTECEIVLDAGTENKGGRQVKSLTITTQHPYTQ